MKEYKQVRYQVRRVIIEMYRDHSKSGIEFPNKKRREDASSKEVQTVE